MRRRHRSAALAALLLATTADGADVGSVELEASWRSDLYRIVDGGRAERTEHIGQLDVALTGERSGLFGAPLRWTVSGFVNDGGSVTRQLGDIQVLSNIEIAEQTTRWNEVHVEQALIGGASLLVGKYDLNAEFDVLSSATPFINSAFGIGTDIGQTGRNGPSIFPATGFGARLALPISDRLGLKLAVLDGVPGGSSRDRFALSSRDGALVVAELDWRSARSTVLFGHWRYTTDFDAQCAPPLCGDEDDNEGVYLRGEHRVVEARDDGPAVSVFASIGTANPQFNVFDRFWSLGLLIDAPFAGRPQDQFGIGIARGVAARERRRALRADGIDPTGGESAIELTWLLRIGEHLLLQPMFQYVIDPGTRSDVRDASVFGLRVELGVARTLLRARDDRAISPSSARGSPSG